MATHYSTPAWKIPWTQSTGSQRVRHDLTFTFSLYQCGRGTSTIVQWLTHSPGTWTRSLQHICIKPWLFVYFPQSQTPLRDWAHTTSSWYTGPLKDRPPSHPSLYVPHAFHFFTLGFEVASLVALLVKNLPAMWETWVWSLGWDDPLEKGKATHSSILAWEFHGLESPWGCQESDTTERLSLSQIIYKPRFFFNRQTNGIIWNQENFILFMF